MFRARLHRSHRGSSVSGFLASLVTVAALASACGAPAMYEKARLAGPRPIQDAPAQSDPGESIDYEHLLSTGIMLRSPDEGWGAHLTFPVQVGWTTFDLSDISLDQVASVAIVPRVEFIVPLDERERWTLLPFVGIGGAAQIGDGDLIGDNDTIGLATGGVQVMRWQPFAERYTSILTAEVRYDAAMTRRNGLLGDWGNVDLAAELRRSFGEPGDGPRFEPGIYAQGFWYWDPIELDIDGVTPPSVHDQLELGISLGSTSRFEILGIAIPRMFVGFRFEQDLQTVQIRFGRL
jgi:hypothetical protein